MVAVDDGYARAYRNLRWLPLVAGRTVNNNDGDSIVEQPVHELRQKKTQYTPIFLSKHKIPVLRLAGQF